MCRFANYANNSLAFIALVFFVGAAYPQIYLHDEIVDHRAGTKPLCTDCDRELATFLSYLAAFEDIANSTAPEITEFEDSAGADFVESRLGILIHKGCLEEGRWNFNFEQALVDGMVKGMSCLASGEELYGDKGIREYTSTKHSLFPQFVNYLDASRWNRKVTPYSKKEGGTVLYDSCRNVKTDPFFGSRMLDKCRVVESFGNRPKIFCDVDLSYEQLEFKADDEKREQLDQGSAYASAGGNDPIIINYKGETRIYNGPTIAFKKKRNKHWSSRLFQSVLFHEMIHNLGYVHYDKKTAQNMAHNDYAQFCQAACFSGVHPALTDADIFEARRLCFSYDTDLDSYQFASELKAKM
jgi:hypothetical protein